MILEWIAADAGARDATSGRGATAAASIPFLRATMCVVVRDLIVVRRPHRHDERPARDLRDVLELRRGRAPFRARARGHARGVAEARPAVRAHRARPPLRRPAVRVRRPLRPRTDARGDVQAAERLRPRRARASGTSPEAASARSSAATSRSAMVGHAAAEATGRKAKPAKNDVSGRDVVVLGSGNLGLVYLMEEEGRMTLEELDGAPPAARACGALASARRLGARALGRARCGGARRRRHAVPRGGSRRRREPARSASRRRRREHLLRTHGFAHAPDLLSAASTIRRSTRAAPSRS